MHLSKLVSFSFFFGGWADLIPFPLNMFCQTSPPCAVECGFWILWKRQLFPLFLFNTLQWRGWALEQRAVKPLSTDSFQPKIPPSVKLSPPVLSCNYTTIHNPHRRHHTACNNVRCSGFYQSCVLQSVLHSVLHNVLHSVQHGVPHDDCNFWVLPTDKCWPLIAPFSFSFQVDRCPSS